MVSAPMEQADIAQFKALIAKRLGLQFDDSKSDFLSDVMRQRLNEIGGIQPVAYLSRMKGLDAHNELRVLAERLTVSETYFFRNRDHFRVVEGLILPELIRRRVLTRQIQILSAGCATGDEAYSIAILLHQTVPDLANWNIKITAVDINPSNLERATRARCSPWALRDTNDKIEGRYFRPEGREFALDESIRAMVSFKELNLADDSSGFWRADVFDVVFCRKTSSCTLFLKLRALLFRGSARQ